MKKNRKIISSLVVVALVNNLWSVPFVFAEESIYEQVGEQVETRLEESNGDENQVELETENETGNQIEEQAKQETLERKSSEEAVEEKTQDVNKANPEEVMQEQQSEEQAESVAAQVPTQSTVGETSVENTDQVASETSGETMEDTVEDTVDTIEDTMLETPEQDLVEAVPSPEETMSLEELPIDSPVLFAANSMMAALNEEDGSGILLDGQFEDWSSVSKVDFGESGISRIAARWYGDYVYFYVEEEDKMGNAMSFTWNTFFEWTSNHGVSYPIRAYVANWDEGPKTLNIQGYNGAQGIGSQVGNAYIWEMSFPVSELGKDIYEIDLNRWTQKTPLLTLTDETGKYVQKDPIIDVQPGSGIISLDGYFDDWDSIYHQDITYGSYNGTGVHNGALYPDGNMLFGHIKMNDQYGAQMPLNAMTLVINGGQGSVQFSANIRDADYNNTWNSKIYNMDVGISENVALFSDNYPQKYLGDAVLHVYDSSHSEGDAYEFGISLETISQLTGIPVESMTQFELVLPNIGNAIIASYGSSTNPVLYLLICIGSIGVGSFYFRRKKQGTAVYE